MEIQQHDGVVVDVAGLGRALPSFCERERCCRGGGRRPRLCVAALPPPLYIGPLGGRRPQEMGSQGGAAATRGEGVALPPKARGNSPLLGFPTLGAWGEAQGGRPSPLRAGSLPLSAHGALRDRWTHLVDPGDPSGGPGTIPVTPETFPVAETGLPIYNSSPPDHSGTSRDVRDLIRDSEQLSGFRILISLQP